MKRESTTSSQQAIGFSLDNGDSDLDSHWVGLSSGKEDEIEKKYYRKVNER